MSEYGEFVSSMNEWLNGALGCLMNEWMLEVALGCLMNEWRNGLINERINKLMNE